MVLSGVGNGQGSFSTAFRWTTTADGPLAEPSASLSVISAGDAGVVDSVGLSLEITNLARTPKTSAAAITVRSATGQTVTLEATRTASDGRRVPEGSVYWDGPDFPPRRKGGPIPAADALGKAPFTYDVTVMLDGTKYTARAIWPRDVIPGNEPYVRLDINPQLPALE